MNAAAMIPVRLAGGPLHLANRTGRDYRTTCGHVLAGEDIEVPPRWVRGRLGRRIDGWARAWLLDLVCVRCDGWTRRRR